MAGTRGSVIAGSALVSYALGALSVVLALQLQAQGLSLLSVGRVLSAGVFGGAVYMTVLMFGGVGLSRRAWLVGLSLVAALAVSSIAFVRAEPWLIACALFGALSGTTAAGPWHPLEQAVLAQGTHDAQAPRVFARYRLALTLAAALGSLSAAVPSWAARAFTLDVAQWQRGLLLLCALAFLSAAWCFGKIAPSDDSASERAFRNPLATPSRKLIVQLCALFGVDHLGSSLANASLVTLWFHERHGLSQHATGSLLAATYVLNAASMWLSGRVAWRFGLVPTMVFTHVPACALLIVAAFAPNAPLAITAWLLRAALSNMDVPPRDAFTMAAVGPEEQLTMASAHLLARSTFGAPGPMLSTLLWQALGPAAPFAVGGALKIAYDLTLYATFREHPASRGVTR